MQTRERLSTIHRNLVVSYDKGEVLGHVTNAYFEKSSCSIRGLSIVPKLIKTDRELFVSFKDIHRLGKNVVIVSGETNLKKAPQKLEGSSLRDLKKIKIVTEDGEHLGELLDVNVFEKSGIISDIVLYGSKNLKIDVEKDKISIGPDMIIVPSGYQKRVEVLKDVEKKGFVANAEKTTRSVTESIKSAILSVTTSKPKEADKAPVKKKAAKEADKAPAKKKPDLTAQKPSQPSTGSSLGSSPKPSPSPAEEKSAKKTAAIPSKNQPSKKTAKEAAKTPAKKKSAKKTAAVPSKKRLSKKTAKKAAKK